MINKSLADSCRSNYTLANPFPHIVIDDFIPKDLAIQCYNQMSQHEDWMFDSMMGYPEDERDSQVNKWCTPFDTDSKNRLESDMPAVWKCLQYFNSRPFLLFLENLTGIKDLIADVDFEGGGIHKIKNGGRLELHSDYNKHPNKDIWRRINLLLYLTEITSKSLGKNFLSKIYEVHHKHKKDYPSGTALMLGSGVAKGKNKDFYSMIGKKYLNKKSFPYGNKINFN